MKRYEVKRISLNWYGIWDNAKREFVIESTGCELNAIVSCLTANNDALPGGYDGISIEREETKMKHYEIRLHIKPTEIKYLGFKQSTNCFATFLMAKDFLAASWRDAARVMSEIFGDEIIDLEITYMPTKEEERLRNAVDATLSSNQPCRAGRHCIPAERINNDPEYQKDKRALW